MVAGTIIGASVFVQPSEVSRLMPTSAGLLAAWLLAGVLTYFGALVCAELASAYSDTGGVYVFLRETFSPDVGFPWGWAMFWSIHSGIIAAVAMITARSTAFFVPLDATGIKVVAVGVVLAASVINYVGVRAGSLVQTTVMPPMC